MTDTRKHVFNAGPSALPLPVLERARAELLDYRGHGLSVLELSHRSPPYAQLMAHTKARLVELLAIPDTHEILFLQGGASTQFAMVPLNLGPGGAYVTTGTWSVKALAEARRVGEGSEVWSDKEGGFRRVPYQRLDVPASAPYLHYTSNNPVAGTQFATPPDTDTPLVADASSDICSRAIDWDRHALVYAGAQKNAGAAGVTLVIGRRELLASFAGRDEVPTMLEYATHAAKDSAYNTPPVFAIYLTSLILNWIADQGGVSAIETINKRKAALIYGAIDARPDLYLAHAEPASRSQMNITFRLANAELEARFLAQADGLGFVGLRGHRSVGGARASIYNAVPLASVQALADLMNGFG